MYIYLYMRVCISMYICIYVYLFICVYVYIYYGMVNDFEYRVYSEYRAFGDCCEYSDYGGKGCDKNKGSGRSIGNGC